MEKFLTRIAKHIIDTQFLGLSKTVILPNRRAGLFLQKRISQQIEQPVFLPKILTIEEFFFQTSKLIKIEPTEQLFRLFESHQRIAQNADSFDQFLNWAQTFISDCNEIDTNLIPIDEFFHLLYQDREIRNWNLGAELTPMQQEYLNFWKVAKDLYVDFTTKMLNQGRAYNGLAYRYTIDHLNRFLANTEQHSLLFAGFNALNRAEEALFDYVHNNELGQFFWDTDAYYIQEENNKAGQYFRTYQKKWAHADLQYPQANIGRADQRVEIISTPNNVAQCELAAQLIEAHTKDTPDEEIAIILADEQLLEPLLYRLPAQHTYNITMGKSLNFFPVYHLFDQLLFFYHNRLENNQLISASFIALLQSPFLKQLEHKQESNQILQFIIKTNSAFISLEEIKHLIDDNSIWRQILTTKPTLTDFFTLLHQIIERLRIANIKEEGRLTIQVLFEIKKIIQQFQTFLADFNLDVSLRSFRSLFQQICAVTKIPYEGEPLKGIQIMGVLETRCLDFDRLILLSANEGTLPKGRQNNSFIPFIFKNHFHIQTFKDKDAIYAYTFYRLLHHCEHSTFLYSGLQGKQGEKSRFLKQLEAELPTHSQAHVQSTHATYLHTKTNQTNYRIEKNEEIIAKIEHYIQHTGISPSAINQLVRSPLDFYFQKIAKIRERQEIETEIEVNTFGTIVHNALEEIYKPFEGQQLDMSFFSHAQHHYREILDEQFKNIYRRGNTNTGINYLYKKAANKLIRECIAVDFKRTEQHEITLIKMEQPLSCTIPLNILGKQYQVKFRGLADRVQQRDGLIEIIDYKTGKVDASKMKTNQIPYIHQQVNYDKLQQILCYTLMGWRGNTNYPLQDIRAAMQPLKSWDQGLIFVNDNPNFSITEEDMQAYISQIEHVLSNLLHPEIPFVPEEDEKKLVFSPYKGIYL